MSETGKLVNWTFEMNCLKAIESLQRNDFTAVYCPTRREAFEYIVREAAEAETVLKRAPSEVICVF